MKIIIIANSDNPEALRVKGDIISWLKDNGQEVVPENNIADLAIILSGDGDTMRGVGRFSPRGIPVLGINAGDVGFLTTGNIENWQPILERVIGQEYKIEERIGLELHFAGKKYGPFANDICLRHSDLMAKFQVRIDDYIVFENVMADGYIISAPTGSTGYNMGAGGPIIKPGLHCFVLTPICPGHLNIRPLVVGVDSKIEVQVTKSRSPGSISLIADGKKIGILKEGKEISIIKHPTKVLFSVFDHKDFYLALQKKKGLMA